MRLYQNSVVIFGITSLLLGASMPVPMCAQTTEEYQEWLIKSGTTLELACVRPRIRYRNGLTTEFTAPVVLNPAVGPFQNLEWCQLQGKNYAHRMMRSIKFSNANLSQAVLDGAIMVDATMVGTNLTGASLVKTNLRRANLLNANLESANLNGADLRDAQLTGVRLQQTQLAGALYNHGTIFPHNIDPKSLGMRFEP